VNKIFIIGYQHSGTTLLSQIFQAHPQVSRLFNEANLAEFHKSMKEMEHIVSDEIYPDGNKDWAWGDKTPWLDGDGERIIKLSKRWLKYFKKQGRVIHILRHPLDVALSLNPSLEKQLDPILSSLPIVINYINSENRATTILYEDLVLFPRTTIFYIFEFCGLSTDQKTLNRVINTDYKFGKLGSIESSLRVFAYKKRNLSISIDYERFINMTKENP